MRESKGGREGKKERKKKDGKVRSIENIEEFLVTAAESTALCVCLFIC